MLKHSESGVENISDAFMQNRSLSVEEVHDYLINLCGSNDSCSDLMYKLDCLHANNLNQVHEPDNQVYELDNQVHNVFADAQPDISIKSGELLPIKTNMSWKIEPNRNKPCEGKLSTKERIYLYKRLTGQDVIILNNIVLTAKSPHVPVHLKTPEWAKFRNILLDYLSACKYYSFFSALPTTEHYRFKFDHRELANLIYSCDILVELSNNSIFTEMFVAYTDQDLPRAKKIVEVLLAA